MNGHRLGDDAPFDLTDEERASVQAVLAEEPRRNTESSII